MSILAVIDNFFNTDGFMPHAMCLLWRPSILWMMVIGNATIALSYFMIPVALIYLIVKRKDIGFKWIFVLFGAFILACGITHVMDIVVLWYPIYGLESLLLLTTGIISFTTAVLLWPLLPTLFKIPSPWQLEQLNQTLQKKNEELTKSEFSASKLAAVVENTDDAIIGKTLDGIINTWNLAAQQLYGYRREEVLGKSITLLIPDDRKSEYEEIMTQVRNGMSVKILDTERKHKDGHLIPVSVTISPIKDKNHHTIAACSVARDISEWKLIQKMKNEFISVVSHELRTPLTSIQGSLSLLLESNIIRSSPEKADALLKIGLQNTERLTRLINDILDIEKIESGKIEFKLETYNINELIKQAILANQSFADKFQIHIQLLQEASVLVNVDRDRLLQVLTNLLSNAIKFAPPKSNINVAITHEGENVKVAITNCGIGIPKEFQKHIFEKFSQADMATDREIKGTGLGLTISKEIIEKLKGTIGFYSDPNKETTFYFTLPIISKIPQIKKYFGKNPSILICDHDKTTSNYLKTFLEKNGFNTILTSTAKETKKVLCEQHIDAILVDLQLEDEDGTNFIKELRTESIHLPIIILSLRAEESKKELSGKAFPVLDWIDKPVDLNRLITSIQSVLKQSRHKIPTILHIEDDVDLLQVVGNLLQSEANVMGATSLKEAKNLLDTTDFDLIILDLQLPDGFGTKLIPMLSNKNIPIIVYTAYELPKEYSPYVIKILLKSRTSQHALLEAIKSALFAKALGEIEEPADES